jgi:hypothetical protein
MSEKRTVVLVVCLCVLTMLLPAGCAKKPQVTVPGPDTSSDSSPTSEATSTGGGTTPGTGESITTPVTGTVARTQLMDAARAKLGTTSQFVVYQLYVQGDQAIGDLEATSGGARQFVAFKGPEWQAVWVAPFGSASASSAAAKAAVSGLSDQLLARLDWQFKKPASDAAMIASLSSSAKQWAKTMMDGLGQPYQVKMAKVAQDTGGEWWGRVILQPTSTATSSFEPVEYWCSYSAGAWAGQPQDPEQPAPTTYFPPSVVGALGF